MPRIFISYSRADEPFATRLAGALSNAGADVWIDVEDIPAGMKWSSAIQEGLDTSDAMLVVVSPDSMASRNVEDEWQYFLDNRRTILTVLYRPTKLHYQLHRIQYVDFYSPVFEVAFPKLLGELARAGVNGLVATAAVGSPARPTRPARPAVTRPVSLPPRAPAEPFDLDETAPAPPTTVNPKAQTRPSSESLRPSSKPKVVGQRPAPPPSDRLARLNQPPPVRRVPWWKQWGSWVALVLLVVLLAEIVLPLLESDPTGADQSASAVFTGERPPFLRADPFSIGLSLGQLPASDTPYTVEARHTDGAGVPWLLLSGQSVEGAPFRGWVQAELVTVQGDFGTVEALSANELSAPRSRVTAPVTPLSITLAADDFLADVPSGWASAANGGTITLSNAFAGTSRPPEQLQPGQMTLRLSADLTPADQPTGSTLTTPEEWFAGLAGADALERTPSTGLLAGYTAHSVTIDRGGYFDHLYLIERRDVTVFITINAADADLSAFNGLLADIVQSIQVRASV
ncbi:MAG: TIR domain-containing protein [Anaerolineae bacterium]|nr:TIR domain-containing protein [Anaerolineae bacterium]